MPNILHWEGKATKVFWEEAAIRLYHNNKTVWMTSVFFEEWLKEVDQHFQSKGWHVTLTVDHFPGHIITYKPTNIELISFEPNLTPSVQPLDAGII